MRRIAITLARLCSFAALAGCSVDVSNLRVPTNRDAASSPDGSGDSGSTADAGLDERRSADVPGVGQDGQAGGDGTGEGGGTGVDGANLATDGALDGASEVAEDSAPTSHDGGGADRAADSIASSLDAADGAVAAPEVGPADVRDLGTDTYETGGKDAGDAGCLDNDCAPFIVPSSPAAMKCNRDGSTAELSWTDFSTWEPNQDSRRCGSAGAYYVQGEVVGFQRELQVLAEVYAPEDATWYAISGGPTVQPDAAGRFNGYFCLPQKGLDRTFRFRIVKQGTSQDAGVACLIHVR